MPIALAWQAFKALGIWRKIGGAFGAAWRWLTASWAHALLVALAAVSLYALHEHRAAQGWITKAENCQKGRADDRRAYQAASKANAKAQADQKARIEAEYKAKAEKADDEYKDALADAGDAASRYIAAHRVRTGPANISAPPATSQDHGAEVPADPATEAVVFSAADVKVCAVDYEYGLAAYQWAKTLSEGK